MKLLRWILPCAVVAALIGMWPTAPVPRRDRDPDHPTSSMVHRLYRRWIAQHESAGGDARVVLPLGRMKGVSEEGIQGRAVAQLDLVHGHVAVDTADLDPSRPWHIWAVLNVPPGSALPDPGDTILDLGSLDRGHLAGDVPARVLADADLLVVADRSPLERVGLVGMPSTFQRLYTASRRRAIDTPWEILSEAHAGAVDADELIDPLVALGSTLFQDETFDGNGRTCGSCHPAANNFTVDPAFIASLPADDPLFVAETNPDLADLEVPVLLRELGLIVENVDGFSHPGVLRSVPHTLGLSTSVGAPHCIDPAGCVIQTPGGPIVFPLGAQTAFIDVTIPDASGFPPISFDPFEAFPHERTGWGGDGAPGSGSLREFAIGAVFQHFPLTLDRVPGVDFRIPTDEELDAMELFQLSLGRADELDLDAITFKDAGAAEGKIIFTTMDTVGGTVQAGKCALCHTDAGANIGPEFGALVANFGLPAGIFGNNVVGTGVSDAGREELVAPGVAPRDGGFGILPMGAGDCLQGQFDVSGPFPIFLPDPPGSEPGGFGGKGIAPFFVQDACLEQFNPPPLVEAADTGPFFHNNAFDTLEEAIEFYSGPEFNGVAAVQLFMAFTDSGKIAIDITPESSAKIGRFLRILNAVENLHQADDMDDGSLEASGTTSNDLLTMSTRQLHDARRVLHEVHLHPLAVGTIDLAIVLQEIALTLPVGHPTRNAFIHSAQALMAAARDRMIVVSP